MKTSSAFRNLLLAIAVAVLFTGCCRSTNCDCVFPSVGIFYESDSLACPSDFIDLVQVESFNQATNQPTFEPVSAFINQCAIDISYQANRYWVISSVSLNISDTVRIMDITFFNPDNKCCDCGDQISSIQLDINGERSAGNSPTRKF